jgi:hypothetical protein
VKHNALIGIVHNVAASLAGGVSFITGFYDLDIYGDAEKSEGAVLKLDLLLGKVVHGQPSENVRIAATRVPKELARLCQCAGGTMADLKRAEVTFSTRSGVPGFTIRIEDQIGRASETDYHGLTSKRPMEIDQRGRVRKRPSRNA